MTIRPTRCCVIVFICCWFLTANPLHAQPLTTSDRPPQSAVESILESGSLTFVPADVAFYSSQWRVAEQLHIFRQSKAFESLQHQWSQNPVILRMKDHVREEILFPLGLDLNWPRELNNQPLLDLAWEALSQEIFIFGDPGWVAQWRLMQQLNSVQRAAQWEGILNGDTEGLLARSRLRAMLADQVDELLIPGIVAGFRIRDPQAAKEQLDQLELWARQGLAQEPEWLRRLERKGVGGGDFLVWNLDGSLVPWEDLLLSEFDEFDDDDSVESRLIPRLQEKTLVLTIGLWRDYLLVSAGRDASLISTLGNAPTLGSRPEFERLIPVAKQPLTSIHFAGQSLLEALSQDNTSLENVRSSLQGALVALPLSPPQHTQVLELTERLVQGIKQGMPRPGNYLSYSFLTPGGYESYAHQWGLERQWDGSAPLSLLDHLGGEPIFWYVHRRSAPAPDAIGTKAWIGEFYRLANDIALENLQGDELATYVRLRDRILPIVQRIDRVHRDVWSRAWTEREVAFVMDGRIKSPLPQGNMPLPPSPLPLPEWGIVIPVADAGAVKAGAAGFLEIAESAYNLLRRESPQEFPPIDLPRPERQQTPEGELFTYAAPDWLGLDSQLALTAGLSANRLAISLSPRTSLRLLEVHPITRAGVHTRVDEPLAAASAFHFPSLVDSVSPWGEYLTLWALQEQSRREGLDDGELDLERAREDIEPLEGEPPRVVSEMRTHWNPILDLLKCYRGTRSITYQSQGAWVTQGEIILTDLP